MRGSRAFVLLAWTMLAASAIAIAPAWAGPARLMTPAGRARGGPACTGAM